MGIHNATMPPFFSGFALTIATLLASCSSDDSADTTGADAGEAGDADASEVSGDDTTRDGSGHSDVADGSGGQPVDAPPGCVAPGTADATARCLIPTKPPEYYVEQALLYFDTLDVDAPVENRPNYSPLVARWEWPPWLLLTGFGADTMDDSANLLRQFDPSTVPVRDCRFFDVQPFARCYISFDYEGGPCPIYEEFVFNDAGEMTFVEAWSDLDGLRPTSESDRWGEAADFPRLSTRIPGLGNTEGLIDIDSPAMLAAAAADPDVADFVERADNFWATWFDEFTNADDDFFAIGCGW